jgi:lysophospholipase L1-like esterase
MAIFEKFIPGLRQAHHPNGYRNAVLFSKPSRTLVLVLILSFAPLLSPSVQKILSLKGQSYREMLPTARDFVAFKQDAGPSAALPLTTALAEESVVTKPATRSCNDQLIEDPERVMDAFNAHLLKTEQRIPDAITRVVHYGDSPITNDGITGTVRELLQKRFGDSGHGFILVDKPWDWYGHQAVNFQTGGGWTSASLMSPRFSRGLLGLGGVVSVASGPGSYALYQPSTIGTTGKKFSRMDVYYLAKPGGGRFTVTVDGKQETVSTDSDEPKSGFFQLSASGNVSSFQVRSEGEASVFGVVLENDDPGVVYDSLGVNGAFAGLLATTMNGPHWTEQLQHRNPNLVILNYGTNESEYASDDQMERYDRELREVISRVRTALPTASILIVSPMDRGKRAPGGRIITMPSIPKIVDMQRRVALQGHCAFLNLYTAMGGEGTMARWHEGRKHLVGADLTHPNGEGAQTVGNLIYMALMEDYDNYRESQQTALK